MNYIFGAPRSNTVFPIFTISKPNSYFTHIQDASDDTTVLPPTTLPIQTPTTTITPNNHTNNHKDQSPASETAGTGTGDSTVSPRSAGTGHSSSAPLADNSLLVDISDALSEKDKVKFTVHTRTTLPGYVKPDFYVVRQHEEFVWLHDRFEENDEYGGYIIPPCPPRPDFDASREKLQRLGEGEGNMTKDEFKKMKKELEA